ncbi:uncharacterized protein EI90DRAFT_3126802 [Cantharellus anzutake]|uniref:uncharacterized protein n=1 Tax=Cantharellus anzutake TaxID=1750568 RepID=UPI0019089CFC|nr:uncharacterized protein EI90DRAFT_3126802 [Cantharellus anzutake]KAF8327790.1 hypothetical protein EI90DRAFT_3126802 [Cantharellus anzutake]
MPTQTTLPRIVSRTKNARNPYSSPVNLSGNSSISSSSTLVDPPLTKKVPKELPGMKEPPLKRPRASSSVPSTGLKKPKPPSRHSTQSQTVMQARPPKDFLAKRIRAESSDSVLDNASFNTPNPRARKHARRASPFTPSKSTEVPFMTLGNRQLSTPRRMSPPVIDLTVSSSPESPSEDPMLLIGRTTRNGKGHDVGESFGVSVGERHRPRNPFTPLLKELKRESPSPSLVSSRLSNAPPPKDSSGNHSDAGSNEQNDADVGYLDENYGFIGDVFEVPTHRGSPSPETLYERSFTKLGQRKPTPRRLVLEGEGDLSAMAKTIYYEHDDDQVEAPSPSPTSRRRNRARSSPDAVTRGSPRSYPRILDGLNEDVQNQDSNDIEQRPVDEAESDKSGYVHDPIGFEVLEEETPDNSEESAHDRKERPDQEKSPLIPPPPSSTPPLLGDRSRVQAPTKEEDEDDPWGKSLDERQPELEATITARFDPSEESPVSQVRFSRGLENRFRGNQIPFSSSPIQSVSTQMDSPSFDRIQVEQTVTYDSMEDDSTLDSLILQSQHFGEKISESHQTPSPPKENVISQQPKQIVQTPSSPRLRAAQVRSETPRVDRIPAGSPSPSLPLVPITYPEFRPRVVDNSTGAFKIPSIRIGDHDVELEDGTEGEGEEQDDTPIVEVSSLDPKAAARAAMILKMHHDYVLEDQQGLTKGHLGRARSRQRTSPRYSPYGTSRSRSRSRPRSQDPNSSMVSLPELLQEAEEEVLSLSMTMSPKKSKPTLPRTYYPGSKQSRGSKSSSVPPRLLGPPKGWCKDDWKNMERAFVKERKIIAGRNGFESSSQVAPMDVDLGDVVDRFVSSNEFSARIRVGPDFERETLLLRAAALQRRLMKPITNNRYETPITLSSLKVPETPSTFGDDFDYDRSSPQSSLKRSTSVQSLPPSLQAPHYAHLHNEAGASRNATRGGHPLPSLPPSRNVSKSTPIAAPTIAEEREPASPSITSRLLDYVGFKRSSATPHPSNPGIQVSSDGFKVPREPVFLPTPASLSTGPQMVQVQYNGPITLPEPLRRASNAPMRDPSVRLSKEYEEYPELRHIDPPPPSTTSPPGIRLRSVGSSGSVKDLVKGFEDLTQKSEDQVRSTPRLPRGASLPILVGRPRATSTSQFSVKSSSSTEWTGSFDMNNSFDQPGNSSIEDTFDQSRERRDEPLNLPASSKRASDEDALPIPKQKRVPETAPPKKRLSFLSSWISS